VFEATRDGASTNSITNLQILDDHGSGIPMNSEEKDHEKDSSSNSTDSRNPQILNNHGSEISRNSIQKNQEENIDETIDITLPDFGDISNDFRDSSQDFGENNQENLENPVNLEEMPDVASTVSISEKCPQFFEENAKNPDVTVNLKYADSPQTSEDLIPTENDVEKSVNLEDHNDEFSESIKSPRNSEDPFPTENDDDQNSMNLEDHNGSEELLNMSLSAALASESERMEITFSLADDNLEEFESEDFGFQFKIPIFKNAEEIFRSHKPKPIK
jgi:hypothetical protein